MENLYTLAKFFIIKIMENFYKQLHLRELSLFITCGGRGRGQGWRALSVEGFARVTITWYPSIKIPTPPLSFPVHRHSILYGLLSPFFVGEDWFPSVPPRETLWSSKILHLSGHK